MLLSNQIIPLPSVFETHAGDQPHANLRWLEERREFLGLAWDRNKGHHPKNCGCSETYGPAFQLPG